MGGNQSSQSKNSNVYRSLKRVIPAVKDMGFDEKNNYVDKSLNVFEDDNDRDQFICAVIAVASNNGAIELSGTDFKLLYLRRDKHDDRVVARIVAIKEGVIHAKIEPALDGENQREAFMALRKDVEVKLDRILQQVPDRGTLADLPSTPSASTHPAPSGCNQEAPPAYGSSDVGRGTSKR